jgi:hypothetical protein
MKRLILVLLLGVFVALVPAKQTWAGKGRWRRRCSCYCYSLGARSYAPPVATGTFTSPKGQTYRYYDSAEVPRHVDSVRGPGGARIVPFAAAPFTVAGDDYTGTDRGQAKTTPAKGTPQVYDDLAMLLGDLPSDNAMLNYDPPITRDYSSPRVTEETKNVTVTAYLYAAKHETDNDFHLILGRTATEPNGTYLMTSEVSGLPADEPSRSLLRKPRNGLKAYFANHPLGSSYRVFVDPIPVRVTGSLFFDVDHLAGVVGPSPYRPQTAWEIHPVTSFEFLGE